MPVLKKESVHGSSSGQCETDPKHCVKKLTRWYINVIEGKEFSPVCSEYRETQTVFHFT